MPTLVLPLGSRVLLEIDSAESKSDGGIVLPDIARKARERFATVIAVGPGVLLKDGTRAHPQVRPGDRVLAQAFDQQKLKVDGVEMYMVDETEILAKVEEGPAPLEVRMTMSVGAPA